MPARISRARAEAAERRIRDTARARLRARGRPTTDRRIHGIIWWNQDDEEPEPWLTVGEDHPDGAKGDPVLIILESARFEDMYFVSTLRGSRRGRRRRRLRWGSGGGWWSLGRGDGGECELSVLD